MKFGDRALGGIVVLCGAALIAASFGFREVPGQPIGAGVFPRLIGGAVVLAGLVLVLQRGGTFWVRAPEAFAGHGPWRAVFLVLAVAGWILLVTPLGFVLATALLVSALVLVLGGGPAPAVAAGPLSALVLYLLFSTALRVPLPRGPVEGYLP